MAVPRQNLKKNPVIYGTKRKLRDSSCKLQFGCISDEEKCTLADQECRKSKQFEKTDYVNITLAEAICTLTFKKLKHLSFLAFCSCEEKKFKNKIALKKSIPTDNNLRM